jgi:hypothetical protein
LWRDADGDGTLDAGEELTAGESFTQGDINDGRLHYSHDGGEAPSDGFQFDLTDGAGGTLNDQSFAITVRPVNDAPAGSDKTLTIGESTPYALKASDFGFSDVEGNAFTQVRITTLPGAGTLTNNGAPLQAEDFVTKAAIDAGHLVFTPAADAQGAAYASFTFQVQDDGGVADGGVDLDPSPNTLTFNVTEAASLVVTTLVDTVDAYDGLTSLREALALANGNADASAITFDAALAGGTLTLTGGGLVISSTVTLDGDIDGNGTADIAISGDADHSGTHNSADSNVISILDSAAALNGLIIEGGNSALGGGIVVDGSGASLVLSNSSVSGNRASIGGGLFAGMDTAVTLTNVTISGNDAGDGGGIYADNGSSIALINSTISGNHARGGLDANGGGI